MIIEDSFCWIETLSVVQNHTFPIYLNSMVIPRFPKNPYIPQAQAMVALGVDSMGKHLFRVNVNFLPFLNDRYLLNAPHG